LAWWDTADAELGKLVSPLSREPRATNA